MLYCWELYFLKDFSFFIKRFMGEPTLTFGKMKYMYK